ncbi:hypothetical protein BC830DRAFT_125281 [Chytriomyces sp. MP71]|nr:hypothetical protein BC830DRAFT_125281 [Chytriomyces sp. MP71]
MSGRQYVTYNFLRCFSMVTILQLKRPSIVPHVRPTTNTLNRMNLGPAAAKRTSIAPPKQAATPGLPQTNEDKRTSLLDVTRESLARQGKTFQLYRVIVCGKIENPDRKPEIAAHYQKFFKLYQTETELITGMLFLLQDTYLHILEGTERVVMAFLRTLRGILPSAYARTPDSLGISASGSWSGYFTNSKVLLMMDDAPIRCFGFWASRTVDVRPGMPPVYIDEGMYNEDNVETTIASICVGLAGIGTSLSELSKVYTSNVLTK